MDAPFCLLMVGRPWAQGTGDFLQLVVTVSRAERGRDPSALKVVLPVCTLPREGLPGERLSRSSVLPSLHFQARLLHASPWLPRTPAVAMSAAFENLFFPGCTQAQGPPAVEGPFSLLLLVPLALGCHPRQLHWLQQTKKMPIHSAVTRRAEEAASGSF